MCCPKNHLGGEVDDVIDATVDFPVLVRPDALVLN